MNLKRLLFSRVASYEHVTPIAHNDFSMTEHQNTSVLGNANRGSTHVDKKTANDADTVIPQGGAWLLRVREMLHL
eukprot:162727-Pyramimonas_sp.AAC.1